jgi:hypothetical protein
LDQKKNIDAGAGRAAGPRVPPQFRAITDLDFVSTVKAPRGLKTALSSGLDGLIQLKQYYSLGINPIPARLLRCNVCYQGARQTTLTSHSQAKREV